MGEKIKIPTDNIPLLDDIVFYLRRLCTESVLKIQKDADNNETGSMHTKAYRYLCAVDNSANFYLYSYRYNELLDAGVPQELIQKAYKDLKYVPSNIRPILLKNKKKEIIEEYVEENPYYRILNGLPLGEEEHIYLPLEMIPEDISTIQISKPLHEYTETECDLLYHYGVIDELKMMYPDFKYLDYLGSKKISIYKARKSGNFDLLYYPTDIPIEITERFKAKLALNIDYIRTVVYSEAYNFKSPYYENFLAVLILVLTMTDIISEMPDMINKNEIFDLKMVRLIFDNYDIDFFDDIPFHFQLAMIKNLHKLLKFKSTTRNILDICSIFGFDDVRVFKYYILKERKTDSKGRYISEYDEETWALDNEKSFDLKFIKVPIKDSVSKYINDHTKYIDYDALTKRDALWDGGLDHEEVKRQILDLEFNHYYTKYLSVDVLNSVTRLSFQLSYFYNILFDDHRVEENLVVKAPMFDSAKDFRLLDLLCYLYALGYRYRQVEDTIFSKQVQALTVMGFNFEADMDVLANAVKNKGYDLSKIIDGWKNPKDIVTVKQLIDVYMSDKQIYDHLAYMMNNAENKREFDVYKMIFESLMITTNNGKAYTMSNGKIAETYTEFIKDRDPLLYKSLLDIDSISNWEDKKVAISQNINSITSILTEYLDSKELDNVFSIFPTVSRDAVRDYVREVIQFFKSYKIDIESVNTILKFDDKFDDKVRILDDVLMNHNFRIPDDIIIPDPDPDDKPPKVIHGTIDRMRRYRMFSTYNENITVNDFAQIIAFILRKLIFNEEIKIDDKVSIDMNIKFTDYATYQLIIQFMSKTKYTEVFDIYDLMKMWSKTVHTEIVSPTDNAIIIDFVFENLYFLDDDFLNELIIMKHKSSIYDYNTNYDSIIINSTYK